MKTIRLAALICLITGCTSAPVNINTPLIGKWSGKDEKNIIGSFIFERSGDIDVIVAGESLGARPKASGARTIFELNSNSKPERFDVVVLYEGRRSIITSCIYRFLTPDEIQLRCNHPGNPVPTVFETKDGDLTIKLSRQAP